MLGREHRRRLPARLACVRQRGGEVLRRRLLRHLELGALRVARALQRRRVLRRRRLECARRLGARGGE
eukprot:1918524-Prymnesium_polylepis.1